MEHASDIDPRLQAALDNFAAKHGGARAHEIRRLSGGASRELWAFSVGGESFVLRRQPLEGLVIETSLSLDLEADLIRRAGSSGTPSPKVLGELDPNSGAGSGFIMNFIEGESLGGRIAKSPRFDGVRPRLAAQCGRILACIHGVSCSQIEGLPRRDAAWHISEIRRIYEKEARPRPVFELALQWLEDNAPRGAPQVLVHGDFRNGNLIVDENGIQAVLDWEGASIGDPMFDLAWLCVRPWRFGVIDQPVGGFGEREDLFAAYEAAGGVEVDPARVRYWELLGSLRWAMTCTLSAIEFREAGVASVDRPMIARRTSESELDLVELLMEF